MGDRGESIDNKRCPVRLTFLGFLHEINIPRYQLVRFAS